MAEEGVLAIGSDSEHPMCAGCLGRKCAVHGGDEARAIDLKDKRKPDSNLKAPTWTLELNLLASTLEQQNGIDHLCTMGFWRGRLVRKNV